MTSPIRFDGSDSPYSPLFFLEPFESDKEIDKQVQDLRATYLKKDDSESSSSFSSSSSASSSCSSSFLDAISSHMPSAVLSQADGSKKRKREKDGDLEQNIAIVAEKEKEVHEYDVQIELLQALRQQKIHEYNQASTNLHGQARQQGKFLPIRYIISPEDQVSLVMRQIFSNCLTALPRLNSRSFVTSLGDRS